MFSEFNLDYSGKVYPYFIYQRLAANIPRQYFLYTLSNGYGYFIRRITARWNESVATNNNVPPTLAATISPSLKIEIFTRESARQNTAIRLDLLTSPSRFGFSSPNASAPNGIDFQAASRKSHKLINQFLPYNDNIHIEITGQNNTTPQPAFFDLMIEGYNILETNNR